MSQLTWFVTKIQSSFYLMAFIQKVNRTQTLFVIAQVYLDTSYVKII